MQRLSVAAFGIAFIAVSSGCGGGGGSTPSTASAPTPTPIGATPTPAGTTSTTAPANPAAATNPTIFSVTSVPLGLVVTIGGGTPASTATTPTSVTPTASNLATTISFTPSNGKSTFVFTGDQRGDGTHTVLYNQLADTNGSIGSIQTTSAARTLGFARLASTATESGLPTFTSRGALGRPAFSTSRLVVRYRNALLASSVERPGSIERAFGVARGVDIGPTDRAIRTRVVDVPAGSSIQALAAQFRARPDVESAAPERLYYKESSTPVMPNDTRFDNYQQWGEFEIQVPSAWGYTTGSTSVNIAVIDTGVDLTHPEFAGGKIAFAESVLNGIITTGGSAAQDTDGHGTNVAGIAAMDTNDGFSYAGTGFNTRLQIYKVFANGTSANNYSPTANSGDVTSAIYEAVRHGAKVINLSLGTCQGGGDDPMQRDAVTYALSQGVVVAAAAGNERAGSTDPTCGGGSTTVDFPAAYDGVIAVGASALNDSTSPGLFATATEKVASYSNSGPGLSLVAPGGDPTAADISGGSSSADLLHWIAGLYTSTAADPTMQCKDKTECRALFAGTSQATPFVSGVAALMVALNGSLTPAQIKTTLMATADDINDPNQGSGRLNAYRALAAVKGDTVGLKVPTAANFVAIAFAPNVTNAPQILDVTYPNGVPVASTGAFRIADIPSTAPSYKMGVWYDANGDGKIDVGDYFGESSLCNAASACASASGIVVHPVAAGFVP